MDNEASARHIPDMGYDTDIAIVGGGLNGTALAIALSSGGFDVTLIDGSPAHSRASGDFDGRSYALALGSQRLLAALGLWNALNHHAQPILEIKVSDGRAGEGASPFVLDMDHAVIEEGPMGFMVEDRHLRPVLLTKAEEVVQTRNAITVTGQSVDPNGMTLSLSNGNMIRARVVIGCDGKTSGTAARSGIRRWGWDYGQTSLVCAIRHERPNDGIAHQFFMPEGPLAILPLKDNRSSIVWTERTDRAKSISEGSDETYLDALRPRFGSFLGDIALAGGRFTYPLGLSIAQNMVGDRLALVGDAAHAVHPIAGQGLNAGLKDVAALAQVLTDAQRRGEDIGRPEVLARYQRWRRFDVSALALATDAFNRLFSNDNGILRLGRDLGLAAVSALPHAKRAFAREAAGLTGDLPNLSRGQPL